MFLYPQKSLAYPFSVQSMAPQRLFHVDRHLVPRSPFLVTRDTDSVGQLFVHVKQKERGQATELHATVRIKLNKIISRTYERTRLSADQKNFNLSCGWKPF